MIITKQQVLGVVNIAVLLVLLHVVYPGYLTNFWGILLVSLAVGVYLMFLTYQQTKKQADQLMYAPSGLHKQLFEDEITKCGLSPQDVRVRYSYADDSVALSMLNTVTIDQMLWKNIDDDPEAIKAKNVIELHIVPTLPENKKAFHSKLNAILSCDAQRFIFKHELGHIVHNYSHKRIALVGVIGTIAAGLALAVASSVIGTLGGVVALGLGMLVGGAVDLLLSYSSNIFFKVQEEQRADAFAVQHSTPEEIEAAATFFAAYEAHAQDYRESIGLPRELSIFLTGYVDGKSRAQGLRDASRKVN